MLILILFPFRRATVGEVWLFPSLPANHWINQFFRVATSIDDKATFGLCLFVPLFINNQFDLLDLSIFRKQKLSRLIRRESLLNPG